MQQLGTQRLETERLILRPFTPADAPWMYANWANDPEVTCYLTWPTHTDVAVSTAVLNDWVPMYADPTYYQWCIELATLGQPIGSIGVVARNDEVSSVHIGYCIGQRWWKQGYTSEALGALLAFFFEDVGVNRVDSRHDSHNPNSGAVMLHCGMQHEGTMRMADHNNQGICNIEMYGILRDEYFARKSH